MCVHAGGIAAWFIYNIFKGQGYSRGTGVLIVARLCASAIIVRDFPVACCRLLACLHGRHKHSTRSLSGKAVRLQVASMTLLLPVTYKMMDALRCVAAVHLASASAHCAYRATQFLTLLTGW